MNLLKEIKKLFSGRDGELSLRRILGGILTVVGIIELFRAETPTNDTFIALAWSLRGLGILGVATLLFGYVTLQNVKDLTNKNATKTPVVEDDGK